MRRTARKKASFTRQVHPYLKSPSELPQHNRLGWMSFVKNCDMLFAHTLNSLRKFLPPTTANIGVVVVRHETSKEYVPRATSEEMVWFCAGPEVPQVLVIEPRTRSHCSGVSIHSNDQQS